MARKREDEIIEIPDEIIKGNYEETANDYDINKDYGTEKDYKIIAENLWLMLENISSIDREYQNNPASDKIARAHMRDIALKRLFVASKKGNQIIFSE